MQFIRVLSGLVLLRVSVWLCQIVSSCMQFIRVLSGLVLMTVSVWLCEIISSVSDCPLIASEFQTLH